MTDVTSQPTAITAMATTATHARNRPMHSTLGARRHPDWYAKTTDRRSITESVPEPISPGVGRVGAVGAVTADHDDSVTTTRPHGDHLARDRTAAAWRWGRPRRPTLRSENRKVGGSTPPLAT
jgi:hypothetical protein